MLSRTLFLENILHSDVDCYLKAYARATLDKIYFQYEKKQKKKGGKI